MTQRFRIALAVRLLAVFLAGLGGALLLATLLDGPAFVLAIAGLLAAGSVVCLLVASGAAAPVERLARAARSAVPEPRPPDATRDELEEIGFAVQAMSGTLKSQASARERETERLRRVLETMVEGVLVVQSDGRVGLENAALRRLLDRSGTLIGRTPMEALRSPEFVAALDRVIAGGEPEALEITLGHPALSPGIRDAGDLGSAGSRTFQVTLAPLGPEDAGGAVAVFHDMTRVRELEGVRRDFVANVSHELRTPLATIKGYVETLVESEVTPEDRRRFLETVSRHTERLSSLIEDLLELSRLESPRTALDLRPIELGAAVNRALQLLEGEAARKGLVVTSNADSLDCRVVADARSLEQVLVNLLDNAIKWTAPGGRVTVNGHPGGTLVRVLVTDTGTGIPPADLPRVFERFFRVDRARTRDQGGTGLGLAIVKRLVQLQGGETGVESAMGRGSTFWFTLPAAPES